ncbi:bone morphogenetic protein 1-like [Branchiostoma floridae]|uniref:Metalloendopeptidase n=1 Tax=Branchiostoma floridae TaxID=7739 RepID=A0A9J7LVU0_BRAFL|nr:bone morphogenetic protein 1-like [Branchiostoma floridae]
MYAEEQAGCTEVELIREAMEEYHLRTCLQFVSRTNQPDYIHIKKNTGCRSYVGVQGGEQEVSFGNGCMHKGIMMHELMHAVGFWHEHSRSDRDEWVAINWDNVQDGQEQNFIKHSQTEVDTLGAPYDYGSIMHYSASSFSKSGLPTIVARNPTDETLGQRDGFSTTDVQKINQLYSCLGVHPDCGSSFLGGPSGEIKSPMHPLDYPDFLNCRWLINATGTEPIILSFKEFSVEAGGAGCIYDALKVYDGTDESAPLLGTYCGETNPLDVTSSGGQMFITFSSDSSYTERGFIIQYSSVRMLVDCDFDTDMCNFFQDESDNFDWIRHTGSTPSGQTGPLTTPLDWVRHYLFIEASSPQEVGHNAILRSPIYPPSSTGYCLDFHYHMYGVNVGAYSLLFP